MTALMGHPRPRKGCLGPLRLSNVPHLRARGNRTASLLNLSWRKLGKRRGCQCRAERALQGLICHMILGTEATIFAGLSFSPRQRSSSSPNSGESRKDHDVMMRRLHQTDPELGVSAGLHSPEKAVGTASGLALNSAPSSQRCPLFKGPSPGTLLEKWWPQ